MATDFDPNDPDPDGNYDVHAFEPRRGANADHMHVWAMSASGAHDLSAGALGVFHFWRLLEGPWVLPDELMQFPFVGLPDAIIMREERRAGRWVHRRRTLRHDDGSPAGEVGPSQLPRPEVLRGRSGALASREAVSTIWQGPGEPPLLAEGLPWGGATKAWITYIRARTKLPLHPAMAAVRAWLGAYGPAVVVRGCRRFPWHTLISWRPPFGGLWWPGGLTAGGRQALAAALARRLQTRLGPAVRELAAQISRFSRLISPFSPEPRRISRKTRLISGVSADFSLNPPR